MLWNPSICDILTDTFLGSRLKNSCKESSSVLRRPCGRQYPLVYSVFSTWSFGLTQTTGTYLPREKGHVVGVCLQQGIQLIKEHLHTLLTGGRTKTHTHAEETLPVLLHVPHSLVSAFTLLLPSQFSPLPLSPVSPLLPCVPPPPPPILLSSSSSLPPSPLPPPPQLPQHTSFSPVDGDALPHTLLQQPNAVLKSTRLAMIYMTSVLTSLRATSQPQLYWPAGEEHNYDA